MRQICSLVYHILTDEKSTAEIAQLDVLLADPKDKEKMLARQNAEAMKALGAMGALTPLPPPAPKRDA